MSSTAGSANARWYLPDGRVFTDNATLAFAALFHAIAHGESDRVERTIAGSPYRIIAYREQHADGQPTFHFEIRPKRILN